MTIAEASMTAFRGLCGVSFMPAVAPIWRVSSLHFRTLLRVIFRSASDLADRLAGMIAL
jgi:hypothetical protein